MTEDNSINLFLVVVTSTIAPPIFTSTSTAAPSKFSTKCFERTLPESENWSDRRTSVYILATTATLSLFPSQCSNYTSITDGTRHVTNTQLINENDGAFFSATPTWVRFEGAAGTRLANYSVAANRCGSETTGWVKETVEPTVGKTANQTVCLNWNQFKCIWPSKVPMTNCGDFFIYALAAPAILEARYCTM